MDVHLSFNTAAGAVSFYILRKNRNLFISSNNGKSVDLRTDRTPVDAEVIADKDHIDDIARVYAGETPEFHAMKIFLDKEIPQLTNDKIIQTILIGFLLKYTHRVRFARTEKFLNVTIVGNIVSYKGRDAEFPTTLRTIAEINEANFVQYLGL